MNETGIEEVQVALFQVDAIMVDFMILSVIGKRVCGDGILDSGGPETAMQDGLRASAFKDSILEAEHAGELVFKTGDGIVKTFFPQGDVVNVRSVGMAAVVDA